VKPSRVSPPAVGADVADGTIERMNLHTRVRAILSAVAWGAAGVAWVVGLVAPMIALVAAGGGFVVELVVADVLFSLGLIAVGALQPRVHPRGREILRRAGIGLLVCIAIQVPVSLIAKKLDGALAIGVMLFGTLFLAPAWVLKDDPPATAPGDEGGEPVTPLPPGYRRPTGPRSRFSSRPPRRPSDPARPSRIRRLLPTLLGAENPPDGPLARTRVSGR